MIRIIPAHAGFTMPDTVNGFAKWDHPRTRGVYRAALRKGLRGGGSSPHTRGLLVTTGFRGLSPGIIPAHAGFTCRPTSRPLTPRDHPRTRGVYRLVVEGGVAPRGSSPHTRGLHHRASRNRDRARIIPAHAGFTARQQGSSRAREDHPRTRGVYTPSITAVATHRGSSPHTRGLHGRLARNVLVLRIIPAHAGFTATNVDDSLRD